MGARLFLAVEWTTGKARMAESGEPKEQQCYQTRNELACELSEQAVPDRSNRAESPSFKP